MSSTEDGSGEPPAKKPRSSTADENLGALDVNPVAEVPVPITTSQTTSQIPVSVGTNEEPLVMKTISVPMATGITIAGLSTNELTQNLNFINGLEQLQTTQGFLPVSAVSSAATAKPMLPIVVVTSGNIRPALNMTTVQSESQQRLPTARTSDGTVTLQISPLPSAVLSLQSKPQTTVQTGVTLVTTGATRFPSPQVVTLQNRLSPTSLLTKPLCTVTAEQKNQQTSILKTAQPDSSKTGEVLRNPASTQISFQVPVSAWNTARTKSLLDNSGKMAVVSINAMDGKSLLNDKKGSETPTPQSPSESPKPNTKIPPKVTTSSVFTAGNKVITNLGPGAVFTQKSANFVSKAKSGFSIMCNKQYTIMPSNSTQVLVKTDTKVNKAKITMAEAQIMLPSGPAKISWPVHHPQTSVTENKQILITSPVIKSGVMTTSKSFATHKTVGMAINTNPTTKVTTLSNPMPTAKVVEVGSTNKPVVSSWTQGCGAFTSTKTSVLPAQKNWELVKQCKQLNKPENITDLSKDIENGANKNKVKSEPENHEISTKHANNDSVSTLSNNGTDDKQNDKTDAVPDAKKDINKTVTKIKIEAGEMTNIETGVKVSDKNEIETGVERMEVDEIKKEKDEEKSNDEKDESQKDDFNPVDVMTWEDGIGELPGSDLKFRMNDLGVLEVITDDLECNETLNTSNESEASEANNNNNNNGNSNNNNNTLDVKDIKMESDQDTDIKEEEVTNKDEITQCENCGEYGFTTDFYKQGRFCSQTCVGAFDSKRMRGVKKHGTMSKMVLGLKKGRKKFLLKDGFNREKDAKVDPASAGKKSKAFVWTRYLEQENAVEAPARLFKNPFPSVRNNFRVGMKLEGVDPSHQSLFCVLSVAEVCGYRIRLHFDGYSECFDFWTDIDSPYIFPVSFCEKKGKTLQPPKGFTVDEFSWSSYLKITKSTPAPKTLFSNQPVQSVTPNLFRVGSKLEAVDKKNSSLICVASVADTLGDKVLIHFDSWEDSYDYWCDMTSPFIHPTGYCDETGLVLSPPIDWKDPSGFTWEKYLAKVKSQAVPARAFKPSAPVAFEPRMKVEVVDRRNPLLVRVATIMEVENHMIRIHFDGWSDMYDYWLDDDSPDLHPPGWCAKTGHPLVPPISRSDLVVGTGPGVCPTPGCKGIGHIKGAKYSGHHSTFGCPYSELNMNKESVLGDRLGASSLKPDDPPLVDRLDEVAAPPEPKRCPTEGCDGSGHVTGKCLTHYKASGCPILHAMQNRDVPKKFGRGRRPKSYYLGLAEQKTTQEKKQERQEKEESLRQGIHNSVFSSSMISTPKTEVPLCWEQHSKLLPGVTNIRGNDVGKWTIEQVAAFVNTLPGCEEQAKLFKEEQIDGEAFLLLTQTDIVKIMNIKLGPALKIFNSIVMFKNSIEV